jgi:hypothetical protein
MGFVQACLNLLLHMRKYPQLLSRFQRHSHSHWGGDVTSQQFVTWVEMANTEPRNSTPRQMKDIEAVYSGVQRVKQQGIRSKIINKALMCKYGVRFICHRVYLVIPTLMLSYWHFGLCTFSLLLTSLSKIANISRTHSQRCFFCSSEFCLANST